MGYKGYSTLQGLHFSKIGIKSMGEFLSTSLWVTGLQRLQHITRVAHF